MQRPRRVDFRSVEPNATFYLATAIRPQKDKGRGSFLSKNARLFRFRPLNGPQRPAYGCRRGSPTDHRPCPSTNSHSRTYTAALDQQIKHDCHACNNQCHLLASTHAVQYDKTLAVSLVPFLPSMLHATHRDHDMKSHDLQSASIPLEAALCAPSRHSITD